MADATIHTLISSNIVISCVMIYYGVKEVISWRPTLRQIFANSKGGFIIKGGVMLSEYGTSLISDFCFDISI